MGTLTTLTMQCARSGDVIARGGDLGGTAGDGPPRNLMWGDGAAYIPPTFLKYFMNIIIIVMSDSWFLSALK